MSERFKARAGYFVAALALISNCFACVASARNAQALEITYIANEGLMLSSKQGAVLIDALFREGIEGYEVVPPAELQKLETAARPFDRVKVILVSHPHRDHFDAASVARHMENNDKAVLLASPQVTDAVKQTGGYEKIKQRIETLLPEGADKIHRTFDRIKVMLIRLRHGYLRNHGIHNLGHIIEIGGKRLLHIGDAEAFVENFDKFNLEDERIDIALLPFWFLVDDAGRTIVDRHIKPKQIVALHIPPQETEKWAKQIKPFYPDSVIFTGPTQSKKF
jgi:L-ascorbate metabolism protein UlaG (beta-lactamase superfamily)